MRPLSCKLDEVRDGLSCAKEFIEAGFAGTIVCCRGQAETLVFMAQAGVGTLQKRELGEHFEAGDIFLCIFDKKWPRLAYVGHVPGAGEPEEAVRGAEPAPYADLVALRHSIGGAHAVQEGRHGEGLLWRELHA